MSDEIRLRREEMFTAEVTRALERERNLRGRPLPPPESLSPARRLLMAPLFYLTAAGAVAALAAWSLLEPGFDDFEIAAGRVVLVNRDAFVPAVGPEVRDSLTLTVETREVLVVPGTTRLEPGADGQAPFRSFDEIEVGTVVEAGGILMEDDGGVFASGLRPATTAHAATMRRTGSGVEWAAILLFPLTAVLVAFALLLAEGIASRNWVRMAERMMVGLVLTIVFAFLGFIPAGIAMALGGVALQPSGDQLVVTVHSVSATNFLLFSACRSLAWGCIGATIGVGMNLARSTRVQLRNGVVGGALGGALGGLFFDPISRFATVDSAFVGADSSRIVGLLAVGTCVGLFTALVERLAREAWLRVRTGPLAGKQFVLYRSPTSIGSAPQADVYLFKDAEIDPSHAAIHRVANRYEIEDLGSRHGTVVAGHPIRRHRLASGDVIVVGATVLEFEERAKKSGKEEP